MTTAYGVAPADATQRAVNAETLSSWSAQRISAARMTSTPVRFHAPRRRELRVDRRVPSHAVRSRHASSARGSARRSRDGFRAQIERERIARRGDGERRLRVREKRADRAAGGDATGRRGELARR